MKKPFLVVPWQENFLASLVQHILADGTANAKPGNTRQAICIFPHARPEKYLTQMLRYDPSVARPIISPQCFTVNSLFTRLSRDVTGVAAWNAGLLDRVGLLLDCVREEKPWNGENARNMHEESAHAGLTRATAGHDENLFSEHAADTSHNALSRLVDARSFFPWGIRLAALFEECFIQNTEPENFTHLEGQAPPFAILLLERLGSLFTRYRQGLLQRGWTTPGRDAFIVAEHLRQHHSLPHHLFAGKRLYIAGFHALSATENQLFQHLWSALGATVILHADPALANAASPTFDGDPKTAASPHWSCRLLQEWAKDWGTTFAPALATSLTPRTNSNTHIRYYEGFDLHSQLQVLQQELSPSTAEGKTHAAAPTTAAPTTTAQNLSSSSESSAQADTVATHNATSSFAADTVVVLPDSGLLMPALHHLPRADINISMGYPLSRSPLFRLLDTLLRLQENRRDNGYYWRDLVELVRHPYLKMLSAAPQEDAHTQDAPSYLEEAQDMSLRRELHHFERALRNLARKFPNPHDLLTNERIAREEQDHPPAQVAQLVAELFSRTLTAFEAIHTPKDMARALEGVCELLLTHGGHLWERFPIDAECLYRIMQSLIPELTHSALADEVFPPETLFSLTRRLMDAERVPFEATPLVGLQVMGMLETRLLNFRRVILLDATEDNLPGAPTGDPLLPEALRPAIGLPDTHMREQVAAYNFFRLLAGADETVILWQEGGNSPAQERKKKKSRFVEELLWAEEKKQKRLLRTKGVDGPLTVLAASISPITKSYAGIPVTPQVRELLNKKLAQPISATLLDAYLRCPVQFFYERVLRLAPADEIVEDTDPIAVGTLLHTVLQEFYTTRLHQPLVAGADMPKDREELLQLFREHLHNAEYARTLPADDLAMLQRAGEERLSRFLQNQPATTTLSLEEKFTATFSFTKDDSGLPCKNPFSACATQLSNTTGEKQACDLQSVILTGTADRIDYRDNYTLILDYKTGKLPIIKPAIWSDTALWSRLENAFAVPPSSLHANGQEPPAHMQAAELLSHLSQQIGSIQLPFYLLLFSLAQEQHKEQCADILQKFSPANTNAAWVNLATDGKESFLFGPQIGEKDRQMAMSRNIPILIQFLLHHMAFTPYLLPHQGKHCNWCSSAGACMVGSAE